MDAELLFELANYLDIDLIWMSQLFDHRKAISSLERYQMPRMNSDFRKHEYAEVRDQLDLCIKNNPDRGKRRRKKRKKVRKLAYTSNNRAYLPQKDSKTSYSPISGQISVRQFRKTAGNATFLCRKIRKTSEIRRFRRFLVEISGIEPLTS